MHQKAIASGAMQAVVIGPARTLPCMPRVVPFLARPVQQRRGVYTAALTTGTEGAIIPLQSVPQNAHVICPVASYHLYTATVGTAVAEPNFTGVEVEVPKTPFVDANQQTIMNTKGSNRIGLGDFTRNDGAGAAARHTAALGVLAGCRRACAYGI